MAEDGGPQTGGGDEKIADGGQGRITGDCAATELSLLVASNSSLIKSLNPSHFKAPTL